MEGSLYVGVFSSGWESSSTTTRIGEKEKPSQRERANTAGRKRNREPRTVLGAETLPFLRILDVFFTTRASRLSYIGMDDTRALG